MKPKQKDIRAINNLFIGSIVSGDTEMADACQKALSGDKDSLTKCLESSSFLLKTHEASNKHSYLSEGWDEYEFEDDFNS